jgi:hypothetical protein
MQSSAFVELLNSGQADKPWVYKEGSYPVLAAVQFNSITVADTANGKFTVSTDESIEGCIVVIYAEPDSGYQLGAIQVNGSAIEGNSFAMPLSDVTVTAEFEPLSANNATPPQTDNGGNTQNPDSTHNNGSAQNPNNAQNPGNTQPPGSSQNGDDNNGDIPKATNTVIYIAGGIVLLCLIAVLILLGIKRKAKKQGEQSR